ATKVFTLKPTIPNTLAIGNYEFRAELTTTAAGDVVGNNSASSNTPFAVGPAFFNLAAQPPISGFNPAILRATKTSDTVDVPVKNLSNTLIPAGTLADVTVSLRRINATSSANDILIGTAPNVSFSNLAQGATKTVHVSSRIPDRLPGNIPVPDAEYEFVATVTPATLVESTLADNTAVGSDIIIGGPFVDLAVVSATHNFRMPAASGSTGIGTVRLRNTGNVLIQGPVNIQFFISTDANPTGIFLGSQTFTLILAPGAISPPISAALGLNVSGGGLAAVEGDIVARINPASFADANVANDSLDAGHVVISSQFVDLRVASATNPFSSTVLGNSTGSGQVLLVNIGSGISVGDVVVKYFATPTGTLNGSEILIGSKTVGISLLSAQLTPAISVDLALPNPAILTNYKIVATITAPAATDNNPNDNLTTILGSVNVLPV
ncbi:MAG TPA: hypothetical protein VHM90_19650, partial [Phycisphaerae bacterium]|nr:hypothetical protein [Phycisphaerae bacterium]